MRKIIAVLMMVSLSIALPAAVRELASTEFRIRAYRIDRTKEVEFVVIDALHSFDQLGYVNDGDELVLDEYVSGYFGDTGTAATSFHDNIIFSYQAAGRGDGNYTVSLSFSQFKSDAGGVIDAGYTLGNVRYIFEESGTSTSGSGGSIESTERSEHVVLGSQSPSGSLSDSWKISSSDGGEWIVRGSVALTLDQDDYQAAAYGRYAAPVTVSLTSED